VNRTLPILARSSDSTVAPRHPARHATNKMAGLLARGSMQLAAFPTRRMRTDISGIGQVLAAYSCGGSRGMASSALRRLDVYHIPSSLSRVREAIKSSSTTLRPHIVNGDLATTGASSRAPMGCPHYCCCRPYALTSETLSGARSQPIWGWRVKRESGESASTASIPELPPQR
jgi:hypothetical protein